MPDPQTLKFYADNATTYARHAEGATPQLAGFLSCLPHGGAVLELGTGNGRDAAAMLTAGFAVTPSDASPELAAEAAARLARDGVAEADRALSVAADMRYHGQAFELLVPWGDVLAPDATALADLAARFHATHRQRFS
ncbi:MAG: hypothetical protein B7Z15_17790 [Rhizobiales bacterium 32-66-8]|nr:MAG: hypothetical protein B7Z15_17790 [Rhizobiales bacterium 32-66-8]